jgi:hypothetical protein
MSKSAKIYGTLALVLIGFPLFLTFWSGASAIIAILLIGTGSYTIAVCLLVASLWHRYRRGAWPIEIREEPPLPRRYPYRAKSHFRRARAGNGDRRGLRYRVSQSWLGWLRRFSSHV